MKAIHYVKVIHETAKPPARRQRRRARRTEEILQVAMELLTSEGSAGLTMVRIAERLDVSPGGLYRYFRSKDELIATLQAHAIGQLSEHWLQLRRHWHPALPLDPKAHSLCEAWGSMWFYLQLARNQPRIFRLISVSLAEPQKLVDDERAGTVAEPMLRLLAQIAEVFEAAAQQQALRPGNAMDRTVMCWSAMHGTLMLAKLDRMVSEDHAMRSPRLGLALGRALLSSWGASEQLLDQSEAWLQQRDADMPNALPPLSFQQN